MEKFDHEVPRSLELEVRERHPSALCVVVSPQAPNQVSGLTGGNFGSAVDVSLDAALKALGSGPLKGSNSGPFTTKSNNLNNNSTNKPEFIPGSIYSMLIASYHDVSDEDIFSEWKSIKDINYWFNRFRVEIQKINGWSFLIVKDLNSEGERNIFCSIIEKYSMSCVRGINDEDLFRKSEQRVSLYLQTLGLQDIDYSCFEPESHSFSPLHSFSDTDFISKYFIESVIVISSKKDAVSVPLPSPRPNFVKNNSQNIKPKPFLLNKDNGLPIPGIY